MIRILQMIGSLNVGGSQTMILNIYRNIDREQMQFDFILDHPDETYFAGDVKALGGRIFTLPIFRGTNAGEVRRDWNNFLYSHPDYHVLHSHVRSYASLYLPVAKKHGLKTIIHSHNISNGTGMTATVKDVLQKPLRYQADAKSACAPGASSGSRTASSSATSAASARRKTTAFCWRSSRPCASASRRPPCCSWARAHCSSRPPGGPSSSAWPTTSS